MKFKGTKGEWQQALRIVDEDGMYDTEVFSGDIVICTMKWAGERIGNTIYSRREANAKLIAASPELLKTLQKAQDIIQSLTDYQMDDEDLHELDNDIDSVLNKVLG